MASSGKKVTIICPKSQEHAQLKAINKNITNPFFIRIWKCRTKAHDIVDKKKPESIDLVSQITLNINQRKQLTHEIEERTCTYARNEKYYNPPKTPKTESKGVVDIDGLNAEQGRHNFKLTEIVMERIDVKIENLNIRTL